MTEQKTLKHNFNDQHSIAGKTILLFGGSYNPAHIGHMAFIKNVFKAVDADMAWMMFSDNPWKDPKDFASIEHRIKMAEILRPLLGDTPCHFSDFEQKLGTSLSIDVITALKATYPDTRFVWCMGSDCIREFHTWDAGNANWLLDNIPVLLVNRPGYEDCYAQSETAKFYDHMRTDTLDRDAQTGLIMVDINDEAVHFSSTDFKEGLFNGHSPQDPYMQKIADYIYKFGLFGLKKPASDRKRTYKKTGQRTLKP